MPTNRRPRQRAPQTGIVISDAALDIYQKMRVIRCTCTPEIFPPDEGWELWEECDGCWQWAELNRQLLRLLGKAVPVYEFATVTPPSGNAVEPERAAERMAAFEEALAQREDKTSINAQIAALAISGP
jgi:hypothetical protein